MKTRIIQLVHKCTRFQNLRTYLQLINYAFLIRKKNMNKNISKNIINSPVLPQYKNVFTVESIYTRFIHIQTIGYFRIYRVLSDSKFAV